MTSFNTLRIQRFEIALQEYRLGGANTRDCLVDILADARHWCRQHGFNYRDISGDACIQHALEWAEEHKI